MDPGFTDNLTDVLVDFGISMTDNVLPSVFAANLVTVFFTPVFVINFLFVGFDLAFGFDVNFFETFAFAATFDLTVALFLIFAFGLTFDFTAITHILSWFTETPPPLS